MAGLEDLYREIILDHYKNPRNRGELPSPPARRAEGFNPLCGDQIVVTLAVDGETVNDVKISGAGCSISQSSASLMSSAVKGKSVDEVRELIHSFKAMMSIHEQSLDEFGNADHPESAQIDESEPGSKLGELEALQGVVKFPVRIKCAVLSWNTLEQSLGEGDQLT